MIVVDTNIIAYLYLSGDFTQRAERSLENEPEWAAPMLWRSEFRNILAGYLRRGQLTLEKALAIQAEAEHLLAGHEYEVDSGHVLELVRATDCSAYDCEFASLAIRLGLKLTTSDAKLLRAFPKVAVGLPKS